VTVGAALAPDQGRGREDEVEVGERGMERQGCLEENAVRAG